MSNNPYAPQSNSPGQYPNQGGGASASGKVKGPALGMLISTSVWMFLFLLVLARNIVFYSWVADQAAASEFASIVGQGVAGSIQSIVGLIGGGVIIFGCIKMMKLQAYGFAFATSILVMIPCISPCCLLGIPFGI
ncbi:hypothetical protein N9049_01715 [bacterium]|nr:hypothetical protein [bacterium]